MMQNGADINDIKFGTGSPQRQNGFLEPVIKFVALFGVSYLFVVLNIIEYSKVRTIWAMPQATQLFTTTGDLNLNIVTREDSPCLPDTAAARSLREVHQQTRVELQLCFDSFQHRICLVYRVHNDDRVMFERQNDAPDNKQLAHDGGFGFAARCGDGVVLPGCRLDKFRKTGIKVFMQLAFRCMTHVMREVVLHEILKPRGGVSHTGTSNLNRRGFRIKANIFGLDGPT